MESNPEFKHIFKSHSNFQSEQPTNLLPLEEFIRIYRNPLDKNSDNTYLKEFISEQIKTNYKNVFIEKKFLKDDEYTDLFNMDYSTLCKKWKEEEEIKKMEEKTRVSISFNPNAFDEQKIFTTSDSQNNENYPFRTFVKPDGTIETRMTIELNKNL